MNEFIFPLRVYVEDTDHGGVVYHANYLRFFERARSEWAEQLGFGAHWQREQKIYFPVRNAVLEYLKPAKLSDRVEVVSRVKSVRKASFVYEQYLRSAVANDTILCRGEIKLACVTHDLHPCGLPEQVRIILGDNS